QSMSSWMCGKNSARNAWKYTSSASFQGLSKSIRRFSGDKLRPVRDRPSYHTRQPVRTRLSTRKGYPLSNPSIASKPLTFSPSTAMLAPAFYDGTHRSRLGAKRGKMTQSLHPGDRPSAVQVVLAWSVHFYTALGLVCAAGMAVLLFQGDDASFRA